MRGADIAVAPQAGRRKIDGKQPPVHRQEEEAAAAASAEQGEGVIFACLARHDFLLKGLEERFSNLRIEVGENGRFFDRAGGVLLEQAAAIDRRLRVVEADLIELQQDQLDRQLRRQRIISAQQDRRIEQLERQVLDFVVHAELFCWQIRI